MSKPSIANPAVQQLQDLCNGVGYAALPSAEAQTTLRDVVMPHLSQLAERFYPTVLCGLLQHHVAFVQWDIGHWMFRLMVSPEGDVAMRAIDSAEGKRMQAVLTRDELRHHPKPQKLMADELFRALEVLRRYKFPGAPRWTYV